MGHNENELTEEDRSHWWLAFPPEVGEEQAKARFRERFGYEPRRALVHNGLLIVGPVQERGNGH